jgi:hypothetical protein
MAELPDVFNASEAEDASFTVIPNGWYVAQIVKSELKDTRNKDGKYIALQFKIVEGEYAKRIVFSNLNIINKSETAVRIAKSDLKKICESIDIESIVDTQELHGIDLQINLIEKPATAVRPAGNEIKDYRSADVDIDDVDIDDSPF